MEHVKSSGGNIAGVGNHPVCHTIWVGLGLHGMVCEPLKLERKADRLARNRRLDKALTTKYGS